MTSQFCSLIPRDLCGHILTLSLYTCLPFPFSLLLYSNGVNRSTSRIHFIALTWRAGKGTGINARSDKTLCRPLKNSVSGWCILGREAGKWANRSVLKLWEQRVHATLYRKTQECFPEEEAWDSYHSAAEKGRGTGRGAVCARALRNEWSCSRGQGLAWSNLSASGSRRPAQKDRGKIIVFAGFGIWQIEVQTLIEGVQDDQRSREKDGFVCD